MVYCVWVVGCGGFNETKHPILLPAKHHFTSLVIDCYHCNAGHTGVLQTLAATHEHFWILNGHSAVWRVIKDCSICRRAIASPGTQFMATLPKFRVTLGRSAFTCVGLNFAGPFMTQYGRSLTKHYLCLFTCLASRAVYLEVAFSLDTDSFFQCFSRFCSRCITPDHVFSDNGNNFVGAERELREGIRRCTTHFLLSKLAMKGVHWHFNPSGSSHYGWIWKRLICSFRRIFTAIVRSTRLDDQALITYATEVECILNDRPLTPVSADSKDLLALTPNTFLKGVGWFVFAARCFYKIWWLQKVVAQNRLFGKQVLDSLVEMLFAHPTTKVEMGVPHLWSESGRSGANR